MFIAALIFVLLFFAIARQFYIGIAKMLGLRKVDPNNPYYKQHKKALQNNKEYNEYLLWADKSNQTFVVDKDKSKQECVQDEKINQLFK